jgi:hypothetical protein
MKYLDTNQIPILPQPPIYFVMPSFISLDTGSHLNQMYDQGARTMTQMSAENNALALLLAFAEDENMIFKAQVGFFPPMPLRPFCSNPLNVNCVPPPEFLMNETRDSFSTFSILTSNSPGELFRLQKEDGKIGIFLYFPRMVVTSDAVCPAQMAGPWKAVFLCHISEPLGPRSEAVPIVLLALEHWNDECTYCGAREVGDAGNEAGRQCWFDRCSRCKSVKYCNAICQV